MEIKFAHSQNFLVNKKLLQRIIDKSGFKKDDLIFDIGAGKGFLTEMLVETGARVWAFEVDPELRKKLENRFFGKNVEISGDFLELKVPKNRHQKIFSNIPFNQTTKIATKVLVEEPYFDDIYLIIQKEAGERLRGVSEGLLISLLVYPRFESKIIKKLSRYDFYPRPKVDSVIIYFKKRPEDLVSENNFQKYQDFISFVIMQQKPTLKERIQELFSKKQIFDLQRKLDLENDLEKSLYQIEKEVFIRLFDEFNLNYQEIHHKVKNSYQMYQDISAKNLKIFRATKK